MRGRGSRGALITLLVAACAGGGEPAGDAGAGDTLTDTLTTAEQEAFAVHPLRYPEMHDGRLDTVDMIVDTGEAAWHIQAMNYTPDHTGMTYATWYTGPDSVVLLAADGQPRLEDDRGNVYQGIVVPDNPRFRVDSGTTAVGVYVFMPGIDPNADSLTLVVNDSTAPVLRVGPFGVRHTPAAGPGVETRPGD